MWATHIFSAKNIRMLYIESSKTVNEITLNELVKLTMLRTTGPWFLQTQGTVIYACTHKLRMICPAISWRGHKNPLYACNVIKTFNYFRLQFSRFTIYVQKICHVPLIGSERTFLYTCTYTLQARRGGSNEYPQSMFLSRNKKNNVYLYKLQFYYIKVGFKGVKII